MSVTNSRSMESSMSSPGEITVELMQQILREVEKDSTIVVLPCLEVDELNKDLHGGSCLSRVTVKYTRHGDTSQHSLSLIVKVVPRSSVIANTVQMSGLFNKEIRMFDEILPRMSTLLNQALPPGRHTDFSARVYYTRKTPSYLIAVEDLAPKGFKAPRRKNGLDLKHCLLAFRAIARFHAASVMIGLEDESFPVDFNMHLWQDEGIIELQKSIPKKIIPYIARVTESWPECGPSWADRLRHRSQTLLEDLPHVVKRNDSDFNVLNHGDFGLHNVMYRHSESNREVEAIMLVDFQCCSYSSPVLDLHQFIFSSASDEVRANYIDTLLREYHAELTATLKSLGAPPERTISLTQLRDEFNNKLLFGFFYATCILPFLRIDLNDNPDLTIDDIFKIGTDESQNMDEFITDSYLTSLRILVPLFNQKQIV